MSSDSARSIRDKCMASSSTIRDVAKAELVTVIAEVCLTVFQYVYLNETDKFLLCSNPQLRTMIITIVLTAAIHR
jgi:hypothetical protein